MLWFKLNLGSMFNVFVLIKELSLSINKKHFLEHGIVPETTCVDTP